MLIWPNNTDKFKTLLSQSGWDSVISRFGSANMLMRIRIQACSKPLLDPYPGDKNMPGIGINKISKQICNKSFKNVMVNLEKLRNNNTMFYTIFKKKSGGKPKFTT